MADFMSALNLENHEAPQIPPDNNNSTPVTNSPPPRLAAIPLENAELEKQTAQLIHIMGVCLEFKDKLQQTVAGHFGPLSAADIRGLEGQIAMLGGFKLEMLESLRELFALRADVLLRAGQLAEQGAGTAEQGAESTGKKDKE
jgi:hypothetical protein